MIGFFVFFQLIFPKGIAKSSIDFSKKPEFSSSSNKTELARKELSKLQKPFSNRVYITADWFRENIPRQSSILFTWIYDLRSINFLTEGDYLVGVFPFLRFSLIDPNIGGLRYRQQFLDQYDTAKTIQEEGLPNKDDLIIISSHRNTIGPRNVFLWVLYESLLNETIQARQAEYIVIGRTFHFLSDYFDENPAYKMEVSLFEGYYKIYRVVDKPDITKHGIFITEKTTTWLEKLQEERPEKYSYVKEMIFEKKLKISDSEIDMLSNKIYPDDFIEVY
jgi:hypothetical protein